MAALVTHPLPSRQGWITVALCVVANIIDGFDVMAIAFAAPQISREWGVDPSALGVLFSIGLAGMAIGSLALAQLADRFGRRTAILWFLSGITVATLLSGFAQSLEQLMLLRFVTGLAVGGILPTLNTVVSEAAPLHRRNLAIGLFGTGFSLGSMIGGILATILLEQYGWRLIFYLGGGATAVVLLLHWAFLSDSFSARTDRARQPIMRVDGRLRGQLIRLSIAFFLMIMTYYFVLTWTPKLLESAGLAATAGSMAATAINFGGLVGTVTYGLAADRLGWKKVAQTFLAAGGCTIALFAMTHTADLFLYLLGGAIGFFLGGGVASLYALAPAIFPERSRASMTGLAIGAGRVGGIVGPLVAGFGITAGASSTTLYLAFAAVPVAVAVVLHSLKVEKVVDR